MRAAFVRGRRARAVAVSRARARPAHQALSVFAYPTLAIRWLMPRWVRFHDRHPDIDLRLTTSVEELDFAGGQYDVAIGIAAFVEQDLIAGRLVRPFTVVRRSRQPLQLLYPAARATEPRLAAFRQWVLQEARS